MQVQSFSASPERRSHQASGIGRCLSEPLATETAKPFNRRIGRIPPGADTGCESCLWNSARQAILCSQGILMSDRV